MRHDIVATARAWIGTPYRHQASRRGAGADCLGLVRGVWREVLGAEPELPPPYLADWAEAGDGEALLAAARRHLREVPLHAVGEGSVLVFRMREAGPAKHMGIVAALAPEPRFVHAYSRHGVLESALTEPWERRIAAAFDFPDRPSDGARAWPR